MEEAGKRRLSGFFIRNKPTLVMGLLALVIAGTADLFAGFFMVTMEDYIVMIPGMIVLIYAAIGMRGNIFGAMGSRLGTAMHMGTFHMNFKKGGVLRSNVESAMVLTMIMSILMAVIGWVIVSVVFGNPYDLLKFIFISTLGGFLAGILVLVVNLGIAYIGSKRNWDVDNITAPLIAAAGDVITVPMIYISAILAHEVLDDTVTKVLAVVMMVLTVYFSFRVLTRKSKRRRKINEAKRIIEQSLPVLLACVFLELITGLLIEGEKVKLIEHAVLMLMMTAFLNEGNALSGMLTSRLSSMLHIGTLPRSSVPPREAGENFCVMYILALITFIYIMTVAFAVQPDDVSYLVLFAIVLVSATIITTVINLLSYYVALAALRFGMDPDDHCIPITSSIMDVVSTVVLMGIIAVFI
ncbi:MAG: magnesium transporter [Candidatus Methanomethylophilaceae archaeon]